MNWKKCCVFLLFFNVLQLGLMLPHDSYQVFLAVASVMLAYGLVRCLFKNKLLMLIFFAVISVTTCQLSITARKAVLREESTGTLVGDAVYGFKHIPASLIETWQGLKEAAKNDNYTIFENLNYRFLTAGLLIPIMGVVLLVRKPSSSEKQKMKG
ncbi:MAG: hypothetical protein COU42_01215 [Candidatus Nealsonbacteria bacterium CG10_big_fil_rev_8_21_14_0_10_36_24]|uniref:Uncharacterized protein n=1 Tax=Candidatus Nealsonbacteria bacterium CG10_big_fil_rev_8_21_14_0_10_36_24 TaxID=1974710 RepID=A0A2M6NS92_9BACT|nr:MAG: hypothetical protein COU42_01215 [Candidatus Nealsonbacteria bacterium CG10_big_fil_rev_8_21_14_0_10_36_24]